MSELICPHCHGTVSRGASVCRGCQAEIEYGVPPFPMAIVAIISFSLGFYTFIVLPESLSFLAWVVGIGSLIAGVMWLNKKFAERVNFKRIYRTK